MTTLTATVVAFLSMTSIQTKGAGYDISSHKALWLAEAGIQRYIYLLKNDSNYRNNYPNLSANLGEGSFLVTASKAGSTYTLTSTGTVSVLNRKITQSVVVTVIPEAFSYVLYADNNIKTSGAENLNIIGDQQSGSGAENFPTVDYTYYQNQALPTQRISGAYTFIAGTYSGIWYIDGNVEIASNVTINGTVISTQRIRAQGDEDITINPTSPYPALIANNDIDFRDGEDVTINGLVYAGADGSGDFNAREAENFNVTGTIIAGTNIDLRDSEDVTISYNSSLVANLPPGFSGGGGTGASVSPQKDWNEVVPAI